MDWTKTGYAWDIYVDVVHQTNVDNTIGSLSGVLSDSIEISENYYSDSRVQAKVSTVMLENESDGYIENARLRIILSIPSRDFIEEMITGYVSDKSETVEHGYVKRTYTIESTIWGLLDHKVKDSITIGRNASLINIWSSLIEKQTKMQYALYNAQDHSYTSTIIYEAGSTLGTILFELTEGYDRIDVDGHGRLILKKYIAPSKQTATKVLDYHDIRNLIVSSLEKNFGNYESPGRAIVTSTVSKSDSNGKNIQEVIVGSYDAPSTHPSSINVRGYLVARSDSYTGNSDNPTKTELNEVARQIWKDSQDSGSEWSANTIFGDYHAGDVCTLIIRDHTMGIKVLVNATTINLGQMTQSLTLKEV